MVAERDIHAVCAVVLNPENHNQILGVATKDNPDVFKLPKKAMDHKNYSTVRYTAKEAIQEQTGLDTEYSPEQKNLYTENHFGVISRYMWLKKGVNFDKDPREIPGRVLKWCTWEELHLHEDAIKNLQGKFTAIFDKEGFPSNKSIGLEISRLLKVTWKVHFGVDRQMLRGNARGYQIAHAEEPKVFSEALRLELSEGYRGNLYVQLHEKDDRKVYHMNFKEFEKMVGKVTIVKGEIEGIWTFIRAGNSVSLSYFSDKKDLNGS